MHAAYSSSMRTLSSSTSSLTISIGDISVSRSTSRPPSVRSNASIMSIGAIGGRYVPGRDHVVDEPPPRAHHLAEVLGIALAEFCDRVLRVFDLIAQHHARTVTEQSGRLRVRLDERESVRVEIEVAEQRHVVGHHVVHSVRVRVVAGEERLLGREPAAQLVAALDDDRPQPRASEVSGCDEPVRPAADDRDVERRTLGELVEDVLGRFDAVSLAHHHATSAFGRPFSGTYHSDGYHQLAGSTMPSSMRMCMRL